MGFKDIKADGLSKELIEIERKRILDRYFGTVSYGSDKEIGQFEQYEQLKKMYIDSILSEYREYFKNIGWSIESHPEIYKARANKNDNVLLSMFSHEICFNLNNTNLIYKFEIISDFQEIGYYTKCINGNKWFDRYERCGGMPIDLERQNDELEEMRVIMNQNFGLNEKYNFRLYFSKDNDEKFISGEYNSIKDFLNVVSDKYF